MEWSDRAIPSFRVGRGEAAPLARAAAPPALFAEEVIKNIAENIPEVRVLEPPETARAATPGFKPFRAELVIYCCAELLRSAYCHCG